MTLRNMLERAAASRAAIDDRTGRLAEARSSVHLRSGTSGTVEDLLAEIVTADLRNALGTLAAMDNPITRVPVDGGVLHSLRDIDEVKDPGGAS
jgi:hypothetical protein